MPSENPYEPPAVAEVSAPPMPDTNIELASLGERFHGAFIDGLISIAFALLCNYALSASGVFDSLPPNIDLEFVSTLILTLVGFAFDIGINWKFLYTSGQTIGKKVAKTRVVTLDGRLPSMFDLVLKRYAVFTLIVLIPVVGTPLTLINILFIFGRERRCLHDLIAGTRVIKAHPGLTFHAARD